MTMGEKYRSTVMRIGILMHMVSNQLSLLLYGPSESCMKYPLPCAAYKQAQYHVLQVHQEQRL